MSVNRISKLNSLIKEEISKIIQKKIEFKKGILVTISKVEVSLDIAHARVYISVIPDNNEKIVLEDLRKNIFFMQQELNSKLVLRKVPKIRFVIDDSIRRAAEMEKLFKKVSSKNRN